MKRLAIIFILVIILTSCSSNKPETSPGVQKETAQGKTIIAPDTGRTLFTLKGTQITGDCSKARDLAEWGLELPDNCRILKNDPSRDCERGNKQGDDINYYYCRPAILIGCYLLSSSGQLEGDTYYGLTEILTCEDNKARLTNIDVKICKATSLGYSC